MMYLYLFTISTMLGVLSDVNATIYTNVRTYIFRVKWLGCPYPNSNLS